MKVLAATVFTTGLIATPIVMLQTMVMPQLNELREFYGGMDVTVQQIVDDSSTAYSR
jgi:hypothetical protein